MFHGLACVRTPIFVLTTFSDTHNGGQEETNMNKKSKPEKEKSAEEQFYLSATSGDTEGEIDLTWEPSPSANSYLVQKCSDLKNPVKWVNEDVVTKSSYTVSKLKSGRKYWFRVSAISRRGQGPWSNCVVKKAP